MSTISQEEMQKRGELIKRARQILVQEFTAMRNQQHQQWLRDSANAWKSKGVLLAYPPAKMYPTEQEVVEKALDLYNRSQQPVIPLPDPVSVPESTEAVAAPIPEDNSNNEPQPTLMQDAFTPSIREQLQSAYNAPIPTSIVNTGGVTEMPPTQPTITRLVEANGDFVIIHEPIVLGELPTTPEPVTPETVISETVTPEPTETEIEEPINTTDEVTEDITEDSTPDANVKHSLLRSVLSGWLSKNKEKDKQ